MSSSGSVTNLIKRVKEGDAAAADELLARHFRRLIALARAKLRGRKLRVADEDDVVQSVLLDFYLGAKRGQYNRCQDRGDLWHLLARITEHKVQNQVRYEDAGKRRPHQADVASSSRPCQETSSPAAGVKQPADPHMSPEVEVAASEEVKRLLERLGDKELIAIAVWKWDGYSNEEIAILHGCSVKTIQRKIKLIQTLWAEENGQ